MNKVFYLIEKAYFVLKILKFLCFPLGLFFPCQSLLEKMIEDKSYSLWRHQLDKQKIKKDIIWYLEKERRSGIEPGQ